MKINNLLKELNACSDAQEWAKNKTWQEIYDTCHRGDWLNWLFKQTNPNDLQLLTLVKGHQVNTIRHLLDERSLKAIDTAIAFGEGKATREELDAADAAAAAADAAAAAAAYARIKNQQETADIFRKYISIDKFNIVFDKEKLNEKDNH